MDCTQGKCSQTPDGNVYCVGNNDKNPPTALASEPTFVLPSTSSVIRYLSFFQTGYSEIALVVLVNPRLVSLRLSDSVMITQVIVPFFLQRLTNWEFTVRSENITLIKMILRKFKFSDIWIVLADLWLVETHGLKTVPTPQSNCGRNLIDRLCCFLWDLFYWYKPLKGLTGFSGYTLSCDLSCKNLD